MPETAFSISSESFPFRSRLSLLPLVHYWQSKLNSPNQAAALLAAQANELIRKAPELLKQKQELRVEQLSRHQDLLSLLLSAVFPPAASNSLLSTACAPFQHQPFYQTPAFSRFISGSQPGLVFTRHEELLPLQKYMLISACMLILERCYKMPQQYNPAYILTLTDPADGLNRHYKLHFDHQFVEIKVKGRLRSLKPAVIEELFAHLHEPERWLARLSPEQFSFEGFTIITFTDVTEEEVLSQLKDKLLQKDALLSPEHFDQIQQLLRVFLRLPDLRLGISSVQKSRNMFINFGSKLCPSFILHNTLGINCTGSFEPIYDKLIEKDQPLVIDDLTQASLPGDFGNMILELGIRNLVLAILKHNDQVQGVLELGSPNIADLDRLSLHKITQLLPLFAVAVKRNAEDLEHKVQTIIKEKFTAIHPTVEWKFTDAALNLLDKLERAEHAEIEPIIFDNVYPLFAAIDIRNSSVERNRAIQEDLICHLTLVKDVLKEALHYQSLPILSELKFLINRNLKRLKQELLSQDEAEILETVHREVEPLFRHLEEIQPELQPAIRHYFNSIDPVTGFMYHRRRDFEQSMTLINETVSAYLDRENEKAQKMYPHYFEKYKSDGVEFKIYVGQSLVENLPFDMIFLKNLRLWQLMVLCDITRMTDSLKSKLKLPLETKQLILVHNQPFSICFRTDERHFDVDGAYNIRYEIIKKRIDKAVISGTNERVTQPGKIAIIFSQEKEEMEYLEYIEYLRTKNYLDREVERLSIQEMQGVSGLRALRVKVLPQALHGENSIPEIYPEDHFET